jgi:hypothetical protein
MSSMLNLCNLYADMGNTATEDQFASLLGIQQQHLEEIITKHNFDVTVMMTLQAFKVYAESMGSYEVGLLLGLIGGKPRLCKLNVIGHSSLETKSESAEDQRC